MYKYEMDSTRTVRATEQTRDVGRMDGRMEWNQYTPQQLHCVEGITITWNNDDQIQQQRLFCE